VLGLWAKTAGYKTGIIPTTFSQVLLDQPLPLPVGDLTPSQQSQLMQEMQDGQIYTTDFSSVKKENFNGRIAYVYKVSIQPVLYLQLIKNYAPFLTMHQLDQLNPNSYDGQPNVAATWTIDAHSKELVQADYGNGRIQTYGGWGIPVTTPMPVHLISATALQKRLARLL
jgi:hypothetical protein